MAELEARGFGEGGQAVCLDCVLDPVLREALRPQLDGDTCGFCGAESDDEAVPIAVDFDRLMYEVMPAVRFLFCTVEDSGMPYDRESEQYVGGTVYDASDVAYEVCEGDVSDDVLEAIAEAITEDQWTPALGTAGPTRPDERLKYGWEALREEVKYRSRFVFLNTADPDPHPDDINAPMLLAHLEQIIDQHDVRRTVPAGRRFWRGRLTKNPDDVTTFANAEKLGSPPRDVASNNRFSPAGISMFYGSDSPDTAIAEIRSHSDDDYAVLGAFETVRDLLLLDLVDLPPWPSVYIAANRGPHYFDLVFLYRFAQDLAQPIVPDDHLHLDYVPTQVVTEYLRLAAATPIDGILFRGVHDGQVNVVLFCDPDGYLDETAPPPPSWQTQPYLRFVSDSARLEPRST